MSDLSPDVIPAGFYCYASLGPMDRRGFLKVRGLCPYWEPRGERLAYCRFLKDEDDLLLWDQVKICGVNEVDDLEPASGMEAATAGETREAGLDPKDDSPVAEGETP